MSCWLKSRAWCKYASWLYIKVFICSLKPETPEDRENRRRKSPPRNRSDFSDSRFASNLYIFLLDVLGFTDVMWFREENAASLQSMGV